MDLSMWIDIISCVFTIVALIFTLYLWLLDQLSGEESQFIEHKSQYIKDLKEYKDHISDIQTKSIPEYQISESPENDRKKLYDDLLDKFHENVENVNNLLSVIVSYRFWTRNAQKTDFEKIQDFLADSRYLSSTIMRCREGDDDDSLIEIKPDDLSAQRNDSAPTEPSKLEKISESYINGLNYIIYYLEDWK